jgi:hypothetical protein
LQGDGLELVAIDDQGQRVGVNVSELMKTRGSVRAWQFSPVLLPWKAKDRFVPLDARQFREIEAQASARPLVGSPAAFVDFTKRFRLTRDVAGYAFRTIHVDRARTVKVLAGSDDALRVWVNGTLVIQALALRSARPDTDVALVELRPGPNNLLVEVSQGAGDWGLYLRLEDEAGRRLCLTDKGELKPLGDK